MGCHAFDPSGACRCANTNPTGAVGLENVALLCDSASHTGVRPRDHDRVGVAVEVASSECPELAAARPRHCAQAQQAQQVILCNTATHPSRTAWRSPTTTRTDDDLERLTSRMRDRSVASTVITDPDGHSLASCIARILPALGSATPRRRDYKRGITWQISAGARLGSQGAGAALEAT